MSDPAIEAAQRADAEVDGYWNTTRDAMEESAREALKPVREVFDRWNSKDGLPPQVWHLLDDLAPLLFTAVELQ